MLIPIFPTGIAPEVVRFNQLQRGDIFQFTAGVGMVIEPRYVRKTPRLTNDGLANAIWLWPYDKAGLWTFIDGDSAVYRYKEGQLSFREKALPLDRPTEQADSRD